MWLLLAIVALGGFAVFEATKKHPFGVVPGQQVLLPGHAYMLNVFSGSELTAAGVMSIVQGDLFTPMGALPTLVAANVQLPGAPAGGGGAQLVSQWHVPVLYSPKILTLVDAQGLEHIRADGSLMLPYRGTQGVIQDAVELHPS